MNWIKKWVLSWEFVRHELEDRNVEELAEEKVWKLLSPVDLRVVIKLDSKRGIISIGDEQPDPAKLSNLKSEADFFLQSELWKIIYETPKELAQRAMFVSSESLDDMKKGKSILYTLDTQKKILDLLSGYQKKD